MGVDRCDMEVSSACHQWTEGASDPSREACMHLASISPSKVMPLYLPGERMDE
jgi:hypothetical protein